MSRFKLTTFGKAPDDSKPSATGAFFEAIRVRSHQAFRYTVAGSAAVLAITPENQLMGSMMKAGKDLIEQHPIEGHLLQAAGLVVGFALTKFYIGMSADNWKQARAIGHERREMAEAEATPSPSPSRRRRR